MMTTWRSEIDEALKNNNEGWQDVVSTTLTDAELDTKFDCGYGGEEGCDFTLWTKDWVYFPVCYDGAEWAGSVPRNPCDYAMSHQGGG